MIEPAQGLAIPQPRPLIPKDADFGIAWYNGLSKAERALWHRVADSAVPADAWRAFQAGMTLPD